MSATSTLSSSPTATSAAPSSTSSSSSSDSGTNKPLLFFVALGFGVVFTNLWIIVGVKYCFRYNQRSRLLNSNNENGDQIELGSQPRRRRREKKLLSTDEVNNRFPLTTYKAWRASRFDDGLPTAGGVTAPPSRAPSISGVKSTSHVTTREFYSPSNPDSDATVKVTPIGSAAPRTEVQDFAASRHAAVGADAVAELTQKASEKTAVSSVKDIEAADDDMDATEHIHPALPVDLMNTPGDACAVCLENLEDVDEIRGLSCGHAFHSGCIDPWLTHRKACCPLCKTDFFVPKVHSDADDVQTSNTESPRQTENGTEAPPSQGSAAVSRFRLGGIFARRSRPQQPTLGVPAESDTSATATTTASGITESPTEGAETPATTTASNRGQRLRSFFTSVPVTPASGRRAPYFSPTSSRRQIAITPAQLEAGVAPATGIAASGSQSGAPNSGGLHF